MTTITLENNTEKTLFLKHDELYELRNIRLIQNITKKGSRAYKVRFSNKEINDENKGFILPFTEMATINGTFYILSKKYGLELQVSNI